MLLQFRVVVTGVLFQILFSKRLTFLQWTSLFLLTIGCMIKYIDFTNLNKDLSSPKTNYESYMFNKNFLFVMLQVFSSCFAGVYNEYLIKKKTHENSKSLDIWIHNSFFCLQSILCCVIYLLGIRFGDLADTVPVEVVNISLGPIFNLQVLLIILNNAAAGLITSLFLSMLNSILKTYASALELVLTAFLTKIIFGVPLNLWTFISISLILFSTFIYAKNPVKTNDYEAQLPVANKKYYSRSI
jgi:UDP-sugar transporter A1/2/3